MSIGSLTTLSIESNVFIVSRGVILMKQNAQSENTLREIAHYKSISELWSPQSQFIDNNSLLKCRVHLCTKHSIQRAEFVRNAIWLNTEGR